MEHKYQLLNPKKYLGNTTNIYYRSSWEKKFMLFLEQSPVITQWSSEELIVHYFSIVDRKWHRYFPDFFVEFHTGHKFIIEIKPFSQRIYNKKGHQQFLVNQSKWQFAKQFAEEHGMEFLVFDEYDLRQIGIPIPVTTRGTQKQKKLYEVNQQYGQAVAKFIAPLLTEANNHA